MAATVLEEEVKNVVAKRFFGKYDTTEILGKIDFSVKESNAPCGMFGSEYYLWAEAKRGTVSDIYASLVQLVITIGKDKWQERNIPPKYLGAFDEGKFAFLEFYHIADIFYVTDFNWNVAPSDHNTREFRLLYGRLKNDLEENVLVFKYEDDDRDLRNFIASKFKRGKNDGRGVNVTRNNFVYVFQKWLENVKPTIDAEWKDIPQSNVVDFFYADLISHDDISMKGGLKVALIKDNYKLLEELRKGRRNLYSDNGFTDGQKAYREFWNIYNRPPRDEFIKYILDRRDVLMPKDLREYRGAYYTPELWVQKSQEYLAAELGEDWQDQYYVWDCCAGSGNMLLGLTEQYRLYASTYDAGDVLIMQDRIKNKSINLIEKHVFQFDFLNGSFDELPDSLREIISDPERRKKLVIYINPPYGEGDNREGLGRTGIAKTNIHAKYADFMGYGRREVFVQFLTRIYKEIPGCIIANFSTLKGLQAPKFIVFRQNFRAKLRRMFFVPAKTFDNVDGTFPIGFFIWDTQRGETFNGFESDVYNRKGERLPSKWLHNYDGHKVINDWVKSFRDKATEKSPTKSGSIATAIAIASDFQNQGTVRTERINKPWNHQFQWQVTANNILPSCVVLAVRLIIPDTWVNDRDLFLWPKDSWATDMPFVSDCLVWWLFNRQNQIKSSECVNHWIPFSEGEVGASEMFRSHFMYDFIHGKRKVQTRQQEKDLFGVADETVTQPGTQSLVFSPEARAVFDAGRELWRYYHKQPGAIPDASYYDIRRHFQGEKKNKQGVAQMCPDSGADATYTALLGTLRQRMKALAARIEPKIYEHGFLLPETQA